jgi:Undecaprenyl-phosphate galactose phosphotransferase WbaP
MSNTIEPASILHEAPSQIRGVQSNKNTRLIMGILLLCSDLLAFILAGFLSIIIRSLFGDHWRYDLFIQIVPVMLVSGFLFALYGLYPGVGLSAVEELKRLVTGNTLLVLVFAALSFWFRNAEEFSRLTLTSTWILSIILLPFMRDLTRTIGIRIGLWGEPVAIIGFGSQGQWALQYFRRNLKLGVRPVVVMDLREINDYDDPGVQVLKIDDLMLGRKFNQLTGVKTAVVALADVPPDFLDYITANRQGGFDRLILIPSLEQISSYGAVSFDFGGVLGLEVRHNLLDLRQRIFKRILDLSIVVFGGLITSPIILTIFILVLLDTRGDPFYRQSRIGKNGKRFSALKFRTMVKNADAVLLDYLEKYPDLKKEWAANFKLKNDPRVTKIGQFLRKYSLDELPQLVNVIRGEMSLVGPRPIVDNEMHYYGDVLGPYTWVRPGITGLWQVSGRSDTTYAERVHLDEYYIRNWSIWLDVFVLAKTISAVLRREGAY